MNMPVGVDDFETLIQQNFYYLDKTGFISQLIKMDADVKKILADNGLSDAYESLREWYDGYHFGSADVYCPWDVVNHCDKLLQSPDAEPELYWDNTSSNEIIRRFIENADVAVRNDIERLLAGEVLEKRLVLNLTYQELDKKELLWSVMYQTGYLTLDRSSKSRQRGIASFVIPNREIKEIFVEKIREWFAEKVVPGHQTGLYDEIWDCKAEAGQSLLKPSVLRSMMIWRKIVRKR